jgi:hypothetical protein
MRRPQFKIAGLMGLVVLAAVGLFTLRNLPVWWSMSLALFANALARQAWPLVRLAVALNLAATASVLATKGRARATATGYAAGGWIYLWLSFHVPALTDFYSAITTRYWIALNQAHQFHPFSDYIEFGIYRVVAHALATIAAGLAGGLLARGLARRVGGTRDSPTSAPVR